MNVDNQVTMIQSLIMAVLQGVSELFPVSSLGHAVILPHLVGWSLDQASPSFLPFLVTLHLGTAVALAVYFRNDWWNLLGSFVARSASPVSKENRYLFYLLVLGTVPTGILGLVFEKRLAALFGNYQIASAFLVANGILLFGGEWLRRHERFQDLSHLRPGQAFVIGIAQSIALLPGFSRSGATMIGGLMVGLTHQSAARFGFLLSTPIIFGAALLELPKLLQPQLRPVLGPAIIGGLVAGIVAYISTAFLMRYFKTHEVNALFPFGAYCVVLGALSLAI
jgi:undecaprenyl-diphosphatase